MKRRIVFIMLLTFVLAISLVLLNFYLKKRTVETLKNRTKEFVTVWGTYKDESSDEYLESIKPSMTIELYEQYQRDAQTIIEMKAKYPGSIDSEIKAETINLKQSSNKNYIFEAKTTRISKALKRTKKESVEIIWTKEKVWKISEIN